MNKLLYIAPSGQGQTSAMRGKCLRELLPDWEIQFLDPYLANLGLPRLIRAISFRLKAGPMINNIGLSIAKATRHHRYDIVWVDKGTMIHPEIIRQLRKQAGMMVHYTPDPAFTFHQSRLFFAAVREYDYLITTKSYELEYYLKAAKRPDGVILTTQGFDRNIHYPRHDFANKHGVALGGHYETGRAQVLDLILKHGIKVRLCGNGWEKFAAVHPTPLLDYCGAGVFGDAYAEFLSSAQFGYGAISEWIPELHTTRTFEIPACGSALLTVKNHELEDLLGNTPIYFDSPRDMVEKILHYQANPIKLETIIRRCRQRVLSGGFDYLRIMEKLLLAIKVLRTCEKF